MYKEGLVLEGDGGGTAGFEDEQDVVSALQKSVEGDHVDLGLR